ncbi:MAG: triose-phosphate isomerase [Patescibacteria group bacterium]
MNQITKPLIIANWKMKPQTMREASRLFEVSAAVAKKHQQNIELVVCPPFIYLTKYQHLDRSSYRIGGQDCFWENPPTGGAFTGEVSATMLKEVGAKYVIIGHSERREYFGETNAVVAKKCAVALAAQLSAVLCVGERERTDASSYLSFVKQELEESLALVKKPYLARLIIAYEPIWAIGTDEKPITPKEVLEMNLYIKKILFGIWGKHASVIRIIYGGSVAPGYAAQFLTDGGMTGLLVGHQSIKPKNLEKIVHEIACI